MIQECELIKEDKLALSKKWPKLQCLRSLQMLCCLVIFLDRVAIPSQHAGL